MDIGCKGFEEDKEDDKKDEEDCEEEEKEEQEAKDGQDNGEEADNQNVVQDAYDEEENDGEVDYNLKSTAELYKDIVELCEDITHACEVNDEEDAEISALKLEVRSLKSELTITNAKTAKLELELTITKAKTAKLELELADLKKKFDNHSPTDSIPLNEMMVGLGKRKRHARKASAKKTVNAASLIPASPKKKTILKELSTIPVDSRRLTRSSKIIEEIEDPVLKRNREEALESFRVAKARKVEEKTRNLEVLAEQAGRMLDEFNEEEEKKEEEKKKEKTMDDDNVVAELIEPVVEAVIIPALDKDDDQDDKSKKKKSLIKNVKGITKRAERAGEKKGP